MRLSVLPLLAALSLPALADDWSKSFSFSGRPELRVDADDASVSIRPWDRKEIQARVTTVGWRISPSEVRVIDRQSGARLEIDVRVPRIRIQWGFNRRSIHMELQVPREIAANIRTGDGMIDVAGLKGAMQLKTGDGRIEAGSLEGSLEAHTGDGKIRVQGRFDALDLRTGDGSIEAEIGSGSKMLSAWQVHTGDGRITVRLPDSFAAELDVHTGDGRIRSDLPVTVAGVQRHSELHGRLNGGGQLLTIRSNDGSINIERL
jgi:DUF4097 and DUF4098 domain-containing protein YvlB